MSIWSSLPGLGDVPRRDNYTGKPAGGSFWIDVATSPHWNDCVRLCVDGGEAEFMELLDIDEARALAAALLTACDRILGAAS